MMMLISTGQMTTRKSVYQIIEADEKFSILLEIFNKTPLGRAMQYEENLFTFFAPTDGAFYRMFQQKSPLLFPGESKILISQILGRHVIPGVSLYSNDLRGCKSVMNLESKHLFIRKDDHRIFINDAQILTPASSAVNGVVFAIDKVLPNAV